METPRLKKMRAKHGEGKMTWEGPEGARYPCLCTPHAREGQPENQEKYALVVELTYITRADFRETLELQNFPFDVQWFQIKMRAEQSKQVKMVPFDKDEKQEDTLKEKWENSEWVYKNTMCKDDSSKPTDALDESHVVHMTIACRKA